MRNEPSITSTGKTKISLSSLIELLDGKKAVDIRTIDVASTCPFTDYFVIAGATSSRHLKTLCDEVIKSSKKNGLFPVVQGHKDEDPSWIVIDLGNMFLHLFLSESRDYYKIEDIWTS